MRRELGSEEGGAVVSVSRGLCELEGPREGRGVALGPCVDVTEELVNVDWERNDGRQRCAALGRVAVVGSELRILSNDIADVARIVMKEVRCLLRRLVNVLSHTTGSSGCSVSSKAGLKDPNMIW